MQIRGGKPNSLIRSQYPLELQRLRNETAAAVQYDPVGRLIGITMFPVAGLSA
jgi:hypothetical protein